VGGIFLEERVEDVLRKYELEIQRAYRVRGAYILETAQGLYLYKGYHGSEIRAGHEAAIQKCLIERGLSMVDLYQKNREGTYLTFDIMGEPHIVKKWYLGEECNLREKDNVRLAAEMLARLHKAMRHMKKAMPFEVKPHSAPIEQTQIRHLKELQRVRTYIRNKKERNLFEVKYLQCADVIFSQGREALDFLSELHPERLEKRAEEDGDFFHGNYTYHNLILGKDVSAIVQFDKAWMGFPLLDVYYLLRKTLEKNEWNLRAGEWILSAYQEVLPLEVTERKVLYALLWFPDKFWKVANSYYNNKKSRIPGRNLAKLEEFLRQEETRGQFLNQSLETIFS